MGAFDDLIPQAPSAAPAAGSAFADLIPKAPAPVAGPVMMDDGTVKPASVPPLVARFADDPRVQASQAIQRGTLGGELAAAGQMIPEAWRNTLAGSFVEAGRAGLPMQPEAARLNEVADLQQPQVQPQTPFQQHMAQQLAQPGIMQSPDEMRQRAAGLEQEGAQRLADYQQNRLPELAAAQAVPSFTTADSLPGQIGGALNSAASVVAGSLGSPESFVPVTRGATLAGTFAKGAALNAGIAGLTDPYSQQVRIDTGAQDKYSPEMTAMSMALGAGLGGTLNIAPEAWAGARGLLARRGQAPVLPGREPGVNADDLFSQAQARSEGAAVAPDETQSLVNRMTGADLPPSQTMAAPGQRLTPQQNAARRQTESELSALFNGETDIHPGGSVRMGEDGPVVADGALPVRDPTGRQANVDSLAQMREAENLLRKNGIEPDDEILRTVAAYQQRGLSPIGAINAFKRARTAAARDEAGMTPDLERTAGEKANSRQFAQDAFDIAELRRQRRERDLNDWNPDLQADYSAGAPRADEITPRMAQDLAARSNEPAPGVGSNQPAPRNSVDVIGSKSVGGLRGEFQPGERPTGPSTPDAPARQGDTFEGERTEPRLDAPETPQPKEASAPAKTQPEPVAESADDLLARAFAPREKPAAQAEKPNLDHLTPDQQRRAVNLDHEIATSKAFGDPPEDIARLQAEYDGLVRGAPESAPQPRAAEPAPNVPDQPATHPREVLDALDRELAATRWDEKGGRLLRDADGKVSRSKWLSSNPDIQAVLSQHKGMTAEKMRNLVARARSGKGKPLTPKQQAVVDDLVDAMSARNERAPRPPKAEPAPTPKAKKPEPAPKVEGEAPPGRASREQNVRYELDYIDKLLADRKVSAKDLPEVQANRRNLAKELDDLVKARARPDEAAALKKQADEAYSKGYNITHNKDGLRMRGNAAMSLAEHAEASGHFLESQRLNMAAREASGEGVGKIARDNYERAKAEHAERVKRAEDAKEKPDLELKSETEGQRASREKDTKAKDKEQAQARTKAEDKAQADKDRADFKLSGSDRTADVAASHGQGTLLDIGAVPGRAAQTVKALYNRLFRGSDESSMKDVAKDLSAATRDLFQQERPTKRGRVGDTYRRLFTDTDSSMRKLVEPFKGDVGRQVADALHAPAGDKRGIGASLDERRQQQVNPRQLEIEKLDNWLRENKLHTPEAQAQIVKLVENPNTPRRGALGEAANKVEAFYKDMHKYQTEAGVDVGNVKGYFQRVLDNGKVAGHRGGFLNAAKKAYKQDNPKMSDADAQKAAENYWDAEVNGDIQKPGTGNQSSGGATPQHMKARTFSKDAAKHLDSFYVKEIPAMLSTYLHRAVQRAEIAKSTVNIDGKPVAFGDNFKNWDTITDAMRKEDPEVGGVLSEFNKLVGTSAGIMDSKLGSGARNTLGAIKTATTLGSMEKSALSSMTELLTPSMRASMGELHDIPQALKAMGEHAYNSVRTAAAGKSGRTNKLQNSFDVASAAGIVGGSGQHSLMAARASAGEPTQRITSVLLSKFFGRNGLENLTNYQRSFATGQAMDFLQRLSAPGRQGKAKNERFLGELGIGPKDQPAFTKWVRDLGGKHATPADLTGPMGAKYKTAMLRFVDQAIQRPSPSTRPAWANDPLGSTLFQLQSFNYAAQKNILNRMVKAAADKDLSVAERGKMAGSFLAHMAAMTGISGAVWEARDKLYSRPDSRQLTTGAKIERAISGAGALGKFDPMIQALGGGVRYGTSPLAAGIGPGGGNIANLTESLSALAGPNNSPNTNTAERKAARTAFQVLGEPALQAALTPVRASPVGLGLTAYAVPKAGEKLVDAMLPANAANKKELPPIKGLVETISDKITGKDDKKKAKW